MNEPKVSAHQRKEKKVGEIKKEDAFKLMTDKNPKSGVFLTVKKGNEVNTMTIGWFSTGIIWGMDVMMVMVRYIRHTYDLIKDADSFTISVPKENDNSLNKAIGICGSKSGRDIDKIHEAGLTLADARRIDGKVIADAYLHYECEIIYKQAMEPALILSDEVMRYYEGAEDKHNHYHVMFYGKIVDRYNT